MKTLTKISLGFLISLQVTACGSSSDKDSSAPAPTPTPVPDSELGIADESDPASVNLINYIVFDQLVDATMKNNLRKDIARIERFDLESGTDNDQRLRDLLQVGDLTAGTLSLWIKDRIHYLLQPDLSKYKIGIVLGSQQELRTRFFPPDSDPGSTKNVAAIMLGTALYGYSLDLRTNNTEVSYATILVNGEWIHANKIRNGVMQIGPALFDPNYQPSADANAYANTAQRVATLFHEARHADGNSRAGSLGFPHINCPAGVAPELVGKPACDATANGAYSVGHAILKAYVNKCGSLCSTQDKSILNTILLDIFSRIIKTPGKTLPVLDAKPDAGFEKVDISNFSAIPG